jgi:predicted GIY-YIG superfamily endonuclease
MKTALYRHYDAQGALLYVGITANPFDRLIKHKHASAWFDRVERVEIEWHQSKQEAMAAEAEEIATKRPENNKAMHCYFVNLADVAVSEGPISLDRFLRSYKVKAKNLAEVVGVSCPYITDLRYGRRRPSHDVALRIEEATQGAVAREIWGISRKEAA